MSLEPLSPTAKSQIRYTDFTATAEELAALSRVNRETLEALFADRGASYLMLAFDLGVPEGTVKSRLHRARAAIIKMRKHDPAR